MIFGPVTIKLDNGHRMVIFKDARGEWRWQERARNGRIIANGGEGMKRRRYAIKMAKQHAGV